MLALSGASSISENATRIDKALITKTPTHSKKEPALQTKQSEDKHISYGFSGKRNFIFWVFVCLLFIFAIGNMILTLTILDVLRLGQCMESMEIVPDESVIKFFGKIDLDHVYKRDGLFESFQDSPMTLSSQNGSVVLNLLSRSGNSETKLVVNSTGTTFRGFSSFDVRNPDTGESVYSTSNPNLKLASSVNHLRAKAVSTKRITAPLDSNLLIKSDTKTRIKGAEGLHMESSQVIWSADQDIVLQSINGSVLLSGKEGVYIDVKSIPIASHSVGGLRNESATEQFKICVCMPRGKLFRIAVRSGKASCDHINLQPPYNPCL